MELTPETKHLYEKLLAELRKFGAIVVEEKKTSFHIKNKSAFAGVRPRKEYFILNIVSAAPISSPRINKQEQVSKSRFHNEIKIEQTADINAELIGWLKDSYSLMA